MKANRSDGERILAVFIDFENVGLGFGGRRDRFNIERVIERLVEKGKIVAKKAYADWSRFSGYASSLHAAAVELVEIPKRNQTGKNSADIRMCVDAMDLAYSKDHIDTFVIVSGDSDFSPLVSKLKELGKHVIGLGLADSTSELLRDNCDEFIYYEDLDRAPVPALTADATLPEPKRKAFELLLESLVALRRENKEVMFASMVKDTMKRKKPSFNEEYHGYRTFGDLLEDAQRYGIIDLERHKTSGTYVVTRFGAQGTPGGGPPPAQPKPQSAARAPAAAAQPVAVPAAHPPAARGRSSPSESPRSGQGGRPGRPRPPEKPVAPPAPIPQPVDSIPLGRALIEDADLGDEVPSYMSRKPAVEPKAAKPAKPAVAKPAAAKSQAGGRGRGESQGGRRPKAAGDRPARGESRPAESKPARKPAPQAAPKPAVQPRSAADEDDFGAGLD